MAVSVFAPGARRRDARKPGKKFIDTEGLGHVVVSPGVQGLDLRLFLTLYGKDDDRRFGYFANFATKLDPAHFGHREICNYDIGLKIPKKIEPRLTIGRNAHIITMSQKASAQHARDLGLIVYE